MECLLTYRIGSIQINLLLNDCSVWSTNKKFQTCRAPFLGAFSGYLQGIPSFFIPSLEEHCSYERNEGNLPFNPILYEKLNSYLFFQIVVKQNCIYYELLSERIPGLIHAYQDIGSCGLLGNNFNWNVCGMRSGSCPDYIDTFQCRTGKAIRKFFRKLYELDGCFYLYYAEYACTGKKLVFMKIW